AAPAPELDEEDTTRKPAPSIMRPPMTSDQAMQTAIRHHAAGQLAQARAVYSQILAANADHAEALRLLGSLELQFGRADAAWELLTRCVRVAPDSPRAHAKLGEIYFALG